MRKTVLLIVILMSLVSCKRQEDTDELIVNYTYDIVSTNVDMSSYDGINSIDHCFRAIEFEEFFNCVDNKSSAVFYLARTECGCCQTITQYLNDLALEYGIVIYYMDAYQDDSRLLEDEELSDKFTSYLLPILDVDEEGKPVLQTPTLVSIVNGEIYDSLICMNDVVDDWKESAKNINQIKLKYKNILKPFMTQSQD